MKLQKQPRLFAMATDGSATKVQWKPEFTEACVAPCDLYERALAIEAADHLPMAFKRAEDGTYIAALFQKATTPQQLENVVYMIFDLTEEQKCCLEDFSIFIRQSHVMMKSVRVRSFHSISRVRIWRSFRLSQGWEYLNACEMDVLDALQSQALRMR